MKALKITQTTGENVEEIVPRTCKVIQDSLGFCITVRGFLFPGTGFQ